jgi:hypothetical protein
MRPPVEGLDLVGVEEAQHRQGRYLPNRVIRQKPIQTRYHLLCAYSVYKYRGALFC